MNSTNWNFIRGKRREKGGGGGRGGRHAFFKLGVEKRGKKGYWFHFWGDRGGRGEENGNKSCWFVVS